MGRSIDPAVWEQWRARMTRYSGSGLTVAEFCRLEEVSSASFYQWRKKLRTGSAGVSGGRSNAGTGRRPGSFVPVVAVGGSACDDQRRGDVVLLRLTNGVRVEIPCSEPGLVERVVLSAGQQDGATAEDRG